MSAKKKAPKAPKPPIEKLIVPKVESIDRWTIFGLDPSLSRTGYALMDITATETGTQSKWLGAGSIKPEDTSAPIWIRSKMIAMSLAETLVGTVMPGVRRKGLILSMEYPTPTNDFLVALNRIIHLVMFDQTTEQPLSSMFDDVRVLLTNASTLRSLMGLTQRGSQNKKENIAKAYEFIDHTEFPHLDTDSCDAVLLSMMARHTTSYLLGFPEEPPANFALSLTNATKEIKGKGTRARVITKGILHRPEYWYAYTPATYRLIEYDSRMKLTKPLRSHSVI